MLSMLRTLRQPRYAALSLLMIVVALACVAAGTWQIVRFDQKVQANDQLRGNAHAAAVPVARVLPLVGHGTVSADAVRYRTVTATGTFDVAHQGLVRQRSVGGNNGFYVLTPFRTTAGDLLVARGFVAATASGAAPSSVPAPPSGQVTIRGRIETGESKHDTASDLPAGQLASVNPTDQATRLATPVFDGSVQLLRHQPGAHGLTTIPGPSLSNPAGGAVEPQHFAYIVQWYIFALLALAAPLAMVRADRKDARARDAVDDGTASAHPPVVGPSPEPVAAPSEDDLRAAKLADRYGRASH